MKLFRKIRQQLIGNRKFSDYVFYAIGEIILVVIGILIALGINNGSQNRANREKEQIYLQGLKNEFEISRVKLKELIHVNEENIEGARKITAYILDQKNVPDEKEFSKLLYQTFALDVAFNPNNSLLNEMVNSGSLKDVTNPELRIRLTNWFATLDDIAKQEKDLAIQREKILDIFRRNEFSIRTILEQSGVSNELNLSKGEKEVSNLDLLKSIEFENNVYMFILTSFATGNAHYRPLMEDIQLILDLLEASIDP